MNRALVILGLVLPVVPAPLAARTQEPSPARDDEPRPPAVVVSRLASVFDVPLVPTELGDRMIRWRLGLRDLVHRGGRRLAEVADHAGFQIPDLTVLTTQPVASSESAWATSGFGWREDPIRHRRKFHRGDDVRATSGTPVVAAGDGVIVFAGRQGGYGNVIHVDHGGGVITRYAHLRRIEARRDAAIAAGQRIGQVGSTGRATGPHLHFEVRLDGRAVAPATAMLVGRLQRELPEGGRLAAFALTPELQALEESDLDPPRRGRRAKQPPRGSRPERSGRTKRIRPTS